VVLRDEVLDSGAVKVDSMILSLFVLSLLIYAPASPDCRSTIILSFLKLFYQIILK